VITTPLTRLLTKVRFHWTEEYLLAYNQLKYAFTSPPVLLLPDFTQQFVVECDAYGDGLSDILSQQKQPIVYFSEALKGKATLLSTYDKEMLVW
jgi:hypothetical protein